MTTHAKITSNAVNIVSLRHLSPYFHQTSRLLREPRCLLSKKNLRRRRSMHHYVLPFGLPIPLLGRKLDL
jgi:hypothetical protein